MVCLLMLLVVFVFQGRPSRANVISDRQDSNVSISCLIVNLQYVDCNWTDPQMQQTNYTFSSLFGRDGQFRECGEYLQERGHTAGCRIPLVDQLRRFNPFSTKLSDGGNRSIYKNYTDLKRRVKLNPPSNLSVNSSGREGEICVHWLRSDIKPSCVNYAVSYQQASGPWKMSTPVASSSYCVSPVPRGVALTFKVRSGMSNVCGDSDFWSDWSDPVQWIDNDVTNAGQSYWHVLGSVVGIVIVIILVALLRYNERIKVSVAPDPSKSLQDLFKKYNGNVESWVYISRELKDAFDPDYTESPCVVSEVPCSTPETKTKEGPTEHTAS